MKLSDSIIRSAKPNGKVQKLRDGNGLYLHVLPSGKYWRYDYRFQGKRRTLSLGVYPQVSLKQARIDLYAAKADIGDGIDPSYQKQIRKHVSDDLAFESVAREWLDIQDWSDSHRRTVELRIAKDLTPKIGHMRIDKITAPDVLRVLRIIESRGAIETAHRVKTVTSQIMRYAVAVGHISSDPCRDLRGALKNPVSNRYAAIVEPIEFGKLLRAIDSYDQHPVIQLALRLLPYVFLRSGEFRGALWSEIDFNKRMWVINGSRMKMGRDHHIPLTDSSIEILEQLRGYTNRSDYVFPSVRNNSRTISDGTINAALKYLGYDGSRHTPHGFRSSFSSMANESELFNSDVIEIQLAHLDKNTVRAAYNRGTYMSQRLELMQWWSDSIDTMRRSIPDH